MIYSHVLLKWLPAPERAGWTFHAQTPLQDISFNLCLPFLSMLASLRQKLEAVTFIGSCLISCPCHQFYLYLFIHIISISEQVTTSLTYGINASRWGNHDCFSLRSMNASMFAIYGKYFEVLRFFYSVSELVYYLHLDFVVILPFQGPYLNMSSNNQHFIFIQF